MRCVDRLLPFQFRVVHAPGRTMGMADYLSRHPSETNSNDNKIKAGELWKSWFTVNETTKSDKIVSENQKSKVKQNQPIGAKLASASEQQGNTAATSESDVMKTKKEPLKQRAEIIQTSQLSESNSDANDSENMSEEHANGRSATNQNAGLLLGEPNRGFTNPRRTK